MTTVFLTNDLLSVVTGTADKRGVSLTRAVSADTEGCVANGLVTDPERFAGILGRLFEENRLPKGDVSLVADSSLMVSKRLELPRGKSAQMYEFIRMEFAHIERITDPVYSYGVQSRGEGGMVSVLAEMTEKGLVRDLEEAFARAGLRLRSLSSPVAAGVRFLARHPDVAEKGPCSVLVYGGGTLTSLSFMDGVFAFSGRRRLSGDPGGDEFAQELIRGLEYDSRLFGESGGSERLRLYGFEDEESLRRCAENVTRLRPELNFGPLDLSAQVRMVSRLQKESVWPGRFLFALGGLWSGGEGDLLARAGANEEKRARTRRGWLRAAVPIAVLALLLAAWGVLLGAQRRTQTELETLWARSADETLLAAAEEYDRAVQETERLETLKEECDSLRETLKTYPTINSDLDALVADCARSLVTAEVCAFDQESGGVRLDVSAVQVEEINAFINKLRRQDIFTDIDYTGYVQSAAGLWTTSVLCTLCESAGRG